MCAQKIGEKYEFKDGSPNASTEEARRIFLHKIAEYRPNVVLDLLRPVNSHHLPAGWKDGELLPLCASMFVHEVNENLEGLIVDDKSLDLKAVFETPLVAYTSFLRRHHELLEKIRNSVKDNFRAFTQTPRRDIEHQVLKEFLPNWASLTQIPDSGDLQLMLTEWQRQWNLGSNWCADFALATLRTCKVDFIDRKVNRGEDESALDFFGQFESYRSQCTAWKMALWSQKFSVRNNVLLTEKVNLPIFHFKWRLNLPEGRTIESDYHTVFYPTTTSESDFRKQAEKEFFGQFVSTFSKNSLDEFGGLEVIIDDLRRFGSRLDKYISKVKEVVRPFTKRSAPRPNAVTHLQWLLESQVEPQLSYERIAERYGVRRESVSSAIKKVCDLIDLPHIHDNKPGRIKGVKEISPRLRISKK